MSSKISFEAAMEKLEQQVRRLESGSITLDEALSSFEEAVKLVKICNEKLDTAERKIRILTESSDGTVTDAPFDIEVNEA